MATNKELEERIVALETALAEALNSIEAIKDGAKERRGPKTERPMTEEDAYRVKYGDHKSLKHKDAAAALSLSYGQVFSCRGGYTFKHVKDGTRNADGSEKPKEGVAK